jgi:DNA-binding NtrC family response regulator
MGIFEHANNGTLMLDEIGDLPLNVQAKLLRILQNQEVQRVGSSTTRKINVRVIGATHRNLQDMVVQGTFREDLYHRLSMMEIKLPPLSERKEDFILLQRHFLRAFSERYKKQIRGITRRAQSLFARYHWPGNVRELENVIGHACMIVEGDVIDIRDLPERLREQRHTPALPGGDPILPLDEYTRRYVCRVVEHTGNKSHAAEILGLRRATLYRILQEKSMDDSSRPDVSGGVLLPRERVERKTKAVEKSRVALRDS